MNRRSFLRWVGATTAAAVLPLPALAGEQKIPYIFILQPFSPHLDGLQKAKAGMLMNTETDEVFNSIEFVPCYTKHLYVEWENRRTSNTFHSKLVSVHEWDSDVVKAALGPSWNRYTPAGNRLAETYYLYGLQVKGDKVVTPCVLAFSGAKMKPYRDFLRTTLMAHGRPPLFAYRLRISTVPVQNRHGSFFNYRVEPTKGQWTLLDNWSVDVSDSLLRPDHPLLKAAVKFRKQVIA